MLRSKAAILALIISSATLILYGLFLILVFYYVGKSTHPVVSSGPPYFLIPVSIGTLGLSMAVYEVLTLRQRSVVGSLKKIMLNEGYDKDVFEVFSGRGGVRRLAIMHSLETPRLRNEIANLTNTDWKEVDRNIKVLESVNLVRTQFSHGSISTFELTANGKKLMDIIQSEINSDFSVESTVQS